MFGKDGYPGSNPLVIRSPGEGYQDPQPTRQKNKKLNQKNMQQNIIDVVSSKKCSKCGGEAEGWKCPKCGMESSQYDPLHWRTCPQGGKIKVKCKKCGQAEDNCTCVA